MTYTELSMAPCLATGKKYHNLNPENDRCVDCHKSWFTLWVLSGTRKPWKKEPVNYTLKRRGEV